MQAVGFFILIVLDQCLQLGVVLAAQQRLRLKQRHLLHRRCRARCQPCLARGQLRLELRPLCRIQLLQRAQHRHHSMGVKSGHGRCPGRVDPCLQR